MQGWLDLLWVIENVGDDSLEQVEFIINMSLSMKVRTRVREMHSGTA